MFFHFHLLELARQVTAAMRGPEQPIPKGSEPNREELTRAEREIARLEALYALPAFVPAHERFMGGILGSNPGRFFVIMTVIFFAKALGF